MALWHDTIVAYELHSVRREFYSDDGRSAISTVVMVDADDAQQFANEIMWERYAFPGELRSGLWPYLRCRSAEIVQDKATYLPIAAVDTPDIFEASKSNYYAFVTLRYESVNYLQLENWLLEDHDVWYSWEISYDVEFLSLDYTKFVWNDTDKTKLRQDEAPAKRFIFPKYHVIIEHVRSLEITNSQDETLYTLRALEKANGRVNTADFAMWGYSGGTAYSAEQVLLTVNSIKFIQTYGAENIYTLDLTFSIRNSKRKDSTEATWNMFWRPNQENNQANDDWYKILHYNPPYSEAKVYESSAWVDKFACVAV